MKGHVPFEKLPPISGRSDLRRVNGCLMDQREYDTYDWQLIGTHKADDGRTVEDWAVTYAGIHRANEDRRNRIVAARTRRESDDSWSAEVERMVERTP